MATQHKVCIIEGDGKYWVVPGTILVEPGDKVRFSNMTDGEAVVTSSVLKGTPVKVAKKVKLLVDLNSNTDGVYVYDVKVDGVTAQGNSAPRIIIDG